MKILNFKKIDAFATPTSAGNPAGMVDLDAGDPLTPDDMQQVAKELKGFVSEVGYVRPANDGTFALKYYSSERKVAFCGHATIAILYDLIHHSKTLLQKKEIPIETPMGRLFVKNRITEEDAVFISAPLPVFFETALSEESVARALNMPLSAICQDTPVELVNAGMATLMVAVSRLDDVLGVYPDFDGLKKFCLKNRIDIITIFSRDTASPDNTFRSRVFAPAFGYLEDPATGSGNAALGCYALKHHLWDGATMTIEQNASRHHPNIIRLAAETENDGPCRVLFGGSAVTRCNGLYYLY